MESCISRELPRYKCHKEVWALKIKKINQVHIEGFATLHFEEDGYASVDVESEWKRKHDPQAGGYYVVYKDGYKSYSPAEAFEEGYAEIEAAKKPESEISEKELRNTTDATIWATAFVEHLKRNRWKIEDIDEGLMIGWFANAIMAMHDNPPHMTGSEAIFGFCAWLTCRKIVTTMGENHDCAPIVGLIEEFCRENNLGDPRNNYQENLTHPKS